MRQLLPTVGDVDPVAAYLAAARPAPDARPWVTVGMISSLDGATAVDGRSGALGGPADTEVFRAVRAIADVILVGAGTVRHEGYGPVRMSDRVLAARESAGRAAVAPRLVLVCASLDLDPASRVFAGHDGADPVVLTTADADPARRAALEEVAEVRAFGTDRVDLGQALAWLASTGVGVVVCEGGPRLNAALVDADLVDEWCVSLAPLVVGGDSRRLVHGAGAAPTARRLELAQLLVDDGLLFGRWVRGANG